MYLIAFVVNNLVLVGLLFFFLYRQEAKHREDRQALIGAALNAAGAPYVPPVVTREPKEWEPREYSDDGLEYFPTES